MQRDNLQGARGRRSAQKGRWVALPLTPLRFSLCTLFPQTPNPLPATAMRLLESLLIAVTIVNFNSFLERASRSNFVDGNRAHTVRPYRDNAKQCRFCAKKLGR